MSDMTLMSSIASAVAGRRMLDHPFYTAWSKGELTRDALARYAEQYYHWVCAFPTFLSAAHAHSTDLAMRRAIVANLVDEEMGPENHPELWLRFCDALGLDREAVRSVALLPETAGAIDAFRAIGQDSSPAAALAAVYAYESQQPDVMRVKREGLAALYGVKEGHDYFEVHETLDVEHSASGRREIERVGAGQEAHVLQAVERALDATYLLLDGPERLRQAA